METKQKEVTGKSLTIKGLIIGAMIFLMLIPSLLVLGLIHERKSTRDEAIRKIDAKWSYAQTLSGPLLALPCRETIPIDTEGKPNPTVKSYNTYITPQTLDIEAKLYPEERYYGIYKAILYKSVIEISGRFESTVNNTDHIVVDWQNASVILGITDLRGIAEKVVFTTGGQSYDVTTGSSPMGEVIRAQIANLRQGEPLDFTCTLTMNGSGSINFLPIGQTTRVLVAGAWSAPGFIGNYSPTSTIDAEGFTAQWQVLPYNRSLPDSWRNDSWPAQLEYQSQRTELSFGVNLVETVDIYQLNARSAKYALMFIALTFVVFFFVEVIARKRIHPIQYLLVAIALILFYSLLLSFSEPLGFAWAYLIASAATITLITAYAASIFRSGRLTTLLALILAGLYGFLYVILQLENTALMAGSIGLFVVLGIIMYFSRRIRWYGQSE